VAKEEKSAIGGGASYILLMVMPLFYTFLNIENKKIQFRYVLAITRLYKNIPHILYDIHLISRDDRRLPSIY